MIAGNVRVNQDDPVLDDTTAVLGLILRLN